MSRRFVAVWAVLAAAAVAGCAINPKSDAGQALYRSERIADHIYHIEFTGRFSYRSEDVAEGWRRYAGTICGTEDYYVRLTITGLERTESSGSIRGLAGTAYCNGSFVDTRLQAPDDLYASFIGLDRSVLDFEDDNPIWSAFDLQKYGELERRLRDLELERREGRLSSMQLSAAFDVFKRVDKSLSARFDAWRAAFPESFYARYATAVHHHTMSWHERGNGQWEDLTQKQIERFLQLGDRALEVIDHTTANHVQGELLEALRISVLVGSTGSRRRVPAAYEAAITRYPDSVLIRSAYFRHLLPRWAGSESELDALVEDSKRYYARNPSLVQIEALRSIERGDNYLKQKKMDDALRAYEQAIALSPALASAHRSRAYVLNAQSRYIEGTEAAMAAINLEPYSVPTLKLMILLFSRTLAPLNALICAETVTRLNREDAAAFAQKGDLYYAVRRYQDALTAYARAAELTGDDPLYRHQMRKAAFQLDVRKSDSGVNSEERGQIDVGA